MSADTKLQDIPNWLRKNGLRATNARIAVVSVLDRAKEPQTLAQIHEKVAATGCDFATVFRFISSLEGKKLVEKIPWVDGTTRHEICKDAHSHHHYLICRSCNKVEPLDDCVVEKFEQRIAKKKGYQSIAHSLQLSGVCPKCQK